MIQLPYGDTQSFRHHHNDINIIGHTDGALPQKSAHFWLNDGKATRFYLEPLERPSDERKFPYGMRTPGCHRLRGQPGWFNLEIPTTNTDLMAGLNQLAIEIVAGDGLKHQKSAQFYWNPSPVQLPLRLNNFRDRRCIQEVGQAVNGLFEIDPAQNVIRATEPVGADILLLLGPPARSQEATYCVEFGPPTGIWLGVSDFFAGHIPQSADLGIKPGYATNGLASLGRDGSVQAWMAWGDNLTNNPNSWVASTRPGLKQFPVQAGLKYRVRHRLLFHEDHSSCHFRLWRDGQPEPQDWLCSISSQTVPAHLPRNHSASFGLFQYFGTPTQWSDISLRSLEGA